MRKSVKIQFNAIISQISNPSAQEIINLCHTLPNKRRIKPGINIHNLPSLVYNPRHEFYNDQDLGSIFYYEWQKKFKKYDTRKMGDFLDNKPLGSTIYVINLGRNSRIREYTMDDPDTLYRGSRCMLLKAIGTHCN